jgi:TolB protein
VVAAALLAAGAALTLRWRLDQIEGLDLRPRRDWAQPVVTEDVEPRTGPVLVTLEYHVRPDRQPEFLELLHQYGRLRRRDGALRWGVFRDSARPDVLVETFLASTWEDHLRQHERMTVSDQALDRRLRSLQEDEAGPVVSHYVYASPLLFEAPNWTGDGAWLVVNGDGLLFRMRSDGSGEPEQIDLGTVPAINNDHVMAPDGSTVYVSAEDGHLYAIPFSGGSPRRVSNDHGANFHHYLHGVSPDGQTLAYIGLMENPGGAANTNVFIIPAAGGADLQLTDDQFADDGAEFSSDGEWIYFNSERGSTRPGHAQLFRMRLDGSGLEQLTFDDRVNWFPHPSPEGSQVAYVSFPPGTLGHPADREVIIRLLPSDGDTSRDLATVIGGQGTMNVPSWAPDSHQLAFVEYPVSA